MQSSVSTRAAGTSASSKPMPKGAARLLLRGAAALPVASVNAPAAVAPTPFGQELKDAKEAVQLASRLCREVQRQLGASEKVDKKDDSPVTVADYGAQAVVAWSLSRSGAAVGRSAGGVLSMVAEEDSTDLKQPSGRAMLERITQLINSVIISADPTARLTPDDVIDLIDLGGSQGGVSGRHWVLDPIDGTRGFVGMRQYAVCLGMLQDGKVELGVLGCPNLPQSPVSDEDGGPEALARSDQSDVGCLFHAERGHGAYVSPLWTTAAAAGSRRIHVNDSIDAAAARFMESYESRHSDHSTAGRMARGVGVLQPPLRMDSQVKYGLLSRGDASIFMRFPPATYREKIWDHAAGFTIVEEAGGKVTDASGRRLDFSQGRYLDLGRPQAIIAAPPTLHAGLLEVARTTLALDQ